MRIVAKIIYNRKDGTRNAEIKGLRRAADKHAWTTKIKYF